MNPARTTGPRTPGTPPDSPGGVPAVDADAVFDVALAPGGRPPASAVSTLSASLSTSSAPVPAAADPGRPVASLSSAPARVVPAGAGVHRLVFVPGLATAAEVATALAAVPAAAVFMGGSVGADEAEAEFVEFDGPDPVSPIVWPGPLGGGSVVVGGAGSGKTAFPPLFPAPTAPAGTAADGEGVPA